MHQPSFDATLLIDTNRPIRLRLYGERGPVTELLLVKQVTGQARVCGGFEYRLLSTSCRASPPRSTPRPLSPR